MITIPTLPLGAFPRRYASEGLVLHLDALYPRRDGTLPGWSNIWEDLSPNHYDVTFSAKINLEGISPANVSNVCGMSAMPKNPYYTVEVVATIASELVFFLYGTDNHGACGISSFYDSISKGNPLSDRWYRRLKLKQIADEGTLISCYLGSFSHQVRICNTPYLADGTTLPPTSWAPRNNAALINDRCCTNAYLAALRVYNRDLPPSVLQKHWLLDKMHYGISA